MQKDDVCKVLWDASIYRSIRSPLPQDIQGPIWLRLNEELQ